MAQVLIKQKVEEEKMIGYCSECDCKVVKSRCGCDEECPNCGEWLDWDVEEDIDNDIDDLFMDEWGCE